MYWCFRVLGHISKNQPTMKKIMKKKGRKELEQHLYVRYTRNKLMVDMCTLI